MQGQMETALGKIVIDTDVIATYAGSVAVECFGIVGMAAVNMKDGLVKLLKKDYLNHGISVDINELDYMEGVTLTDSMTTLNTGGNIADQFFGFTTNNNGTIQMNENEDMDVEEQITNDIQREIKNTQNILTKLKKDSPNTKLTDQQLMDLYGDLDNDGFIIF